MSIDKLLGSVQGAEEHYEIDMSQEGASGGKLYPEGYAFARLTTYVEFGKHCEEYEGEIKAPALRVRLGFAIWGTSPKTGETYHNDDGTPGFISPFDLHLKNSSKANAKKAFDKMNWKGDHQQFFQMLGEGFLLKIVHKKNKKNEIVARVDLKEILPPVDAVSGQPYPIPELPENFEFRLFLWNTPTKECWDSIFIGGERDDGKSKNWLQETCFEAVDFEGSPLQAMLSDLGDLPYGSEKSEEEEEPAKAEPKKPTPPKKAQAKGPAFLAPAKAAKKPARSDADVPAIPDLPL